MRSRDRRHFIRVKIEQQAVLDCGATSYGHAVSDLSLGGVFLKGSSTLQPGDSCLIRLKPLPSDTEITAHGIVVRVSKNGMAFKFTSMTIDSLLVLQTMLVDETSDALVLGTEPVGYVQVDVAEA